MNFMLRAFSALLLTLVPAFAQDARKSSSGLEWGGAYVGVHAGYAFGNFHFQDRFGPADDKENWSGVVGGGTLGYAFQTGRVVFGAEVDFSASGLKGSFPSRPGWGCGTAICKAEAFWFASARARLGYSFDRVLPYITGGAVVGRFKGIHIDSCGNYCGSATQTGYTLGAGVEYALTRNWSVKTEYLFNDFGDFILNPRPGTRFGFASSRFHVVRAGANYRF